MKKISVKKSTKSFGVAIKKFFKELKRVRWPKKGEANKTYVRVILFVFIIAIILFLVALGLTQMWDKLGVGVKNG